MTRKRVFGIAAILLGLFTWAGAAVVAFSALGSNTTWKSPGSQVVNLQAGRWTVFELLPPDTTAVTASAIAAERTVDEKQISVVGPGGATVPLTCTYCGAQEQPLIPIDMRLNVPLVGFNAPTDGQYVITVTDVSAELAVANPVTQIQAVAPQMYGLGAVGMALIVGGIVLVVRGGDSTSRPSQPMPPIDNQPPPPGWYQNPYLPGTDSQMWWDGKQWTSNWR